ncbi:hypothetical protein TNCV_4807781 [Trichonephila clavipes]|nr:hypothetical protein TNCV_4807781 [Trichonephila clavipes]
MQRRNPSPSPPFAGRLRGEIGSENGKRPRSLTQPGGVHGRPRRSPAELDVCPPLQTNPLRRNPGDKVTNPCGLELGNTECILILDIFVKVANAYLF